MLIINNKALKVGNKWLNPVESPAPEPPTPVDPYNPLGLPPNTVRVRTSDGNVPVKDSSTSYETATLVEGTTDVYDVYKSGTSFYQLLYKSTNVVEILGANTTGIDTLGFAFQDCTSLTSVPLFDTSLVTSMSYTFGGCSSLTSIPLFDTSNLGSISYAFSGCVNVQSGALALYQQVSSQANPPSWHAQTFTNCGSNTTTGAAELSQIPSSWGGTGA